MQNTWTTYPAVTAYEWDWILGPRAAAHLQGGLIRYETDPYFLGAWLNGKFVNQSDPTVRSVDWRMLSSQAMESMLPTFSDKGESIVNFILELKETKSLFDLWNSKQSLLKNIANGHLNYSFGWRPFLSDCSRIVSALASFQKKLRQLQQDNNKPVKRHFRRPMDSIDLPAKKTGSANIVSGVTGYWTQETAFLVPPTYCATCVFKYVLPDMSLVSNQVKAFLDTLGVQADATIIWNAIPYSFVVDWFFNVGGWIHSLRSDNLSIPVEIIQFCHSIKYEWERRTSLDLKYTNGDGQNPSYGYTGILVNSKRVRSYTRRRDLPATGLFDSTTRSLNWSKVLLGASLSVQRFG